MTYQAILIFQSSDGGAWTDHLPRTILHADDKLALMASARQKADERGMMLVVEDASGPLTGGMSGPLSRLGCDLGCRP